MNATAKFYIVFFAIVALVVALAFYAGYRTGYAHRAVAATQHRRDAP